MKKFVLFILILAAIGAGVYYNTSRQSNLIVLTGMVTTDEVIVAPEIQGRLQQLLVKEGDMVTNGQLLGVIQAQMQKADVAFYESSAQQYAAQVTQAKADLENARLIYEREEGLHNQNVESVQAYDQARTGYAAAKARVEALNQQVQAAGAQTEKAEVQLGHTQIFAPIGGIVDTRAALQGEVVNPGQAVVTLINQDDLWVRADVEETYVDRTRIGDKLQVRLPSGATREGTVFFRGVDADYATQRDVSRTKRDIKTFEIRLRCDNHDRALAVGMTAYVALPVKQP
jgi:HlyD family secretion protein